MKSLIILFALLIASPAIADDDDDGGAPAPVVNVTVNVSGGDSEFVGFTLGTITGGEGIVAMNAVCQLEFGTDARLCTSEEYFTSASAAEPLARAWLHPTVVGNTATGLSNRQLLDFSGLGASRFGSSNFPSLSCNGWQSTSNSALTLEALQGGKPLLGSCADSNAVTCCAPAE